MLNKGDYVRMKIAPNTRLGTIEGMKEERGRVQYLFRADPRFYEPLPDSYIFEDEVELCQRPDDERARHINDLISRGGG